MLTFLKIHYNNNSREIYTFRDIKKKKQIELENCEENLLC